jgi:hypothetical protein
MTSPVYIGTNSIVINPATMNRIIQDWLHVTHDGGPYEVGSVEQNPDGRFVIMFDAAEEKKGGAS